MFSIELSFTSKPDRGWLTRVLFSAVAHGVRFNSGGFEGSYRIIPDDPADEIVVRKSGNLERTEMLADTAEAYATFDPGTTELALMTTYTGTESEIPCSIQLLPRGSGYLLSFGTNQQEIRSEKNIKSFVNLPKAIFERFEFIYGASRYGEQEHVPTTLESVREDDPRVITFYSSLLVEEIGRDRLLSSPASAVCELENGGLFMRTSLVNNAKQKEEIQHIKEHLDK